MERYLNVDPSSDAELWACLRCPGCTGRQRRLTQTSWQPVEPERSFWFSETLSQGHKAESKRHLASYSDLCTDAHTTHTQHTPQKAKCKPASLLWSLCVYLAAAVFWSRHRCGSDWPRTHELVQVLNSCFLLPPLLVLGLQMWAHVLLLLCGEKQSACLSPERWD